MCHYSMFRKSNTFGIHIEVLLTIKRIMNITTIRQRRNDLLTSLGMDNISIEEYTSSMKELEKEEMGIVVSVRRSM